MARAEIEEKNLPGGMILTQNEKVERFVMESLARVDKGFKPLLRSLSNSG